MNYEIIIYEIVYTFFGDERESIVFSSSHRYSRKLLAVIPAKAGISSRCLSFFLENF
jgi:hypothetical protein